MVYPTEAVGLEDLQKGTVEGDAATVAAHVALSLSALFGLPDPGGLEKAEEGPPDFAGKGQKKGLHSPVFLSGVGSMNAPRKLQ